MYLEEYNCTLQLTADDHWLISLHLMA
jgi:hypothetical protein